MTQTEKILQLSSSTGICLSEVAVVTVATRNYFHRVRALFDAVAELMPGAVRMACCPDPFEGFLTSVQEGFEIMDGRDLGVPRFDEFVFALNPTALCCALKPFAVLRALEREGIKSVLYIDNDMGLYGSPDELLDLLKERSFVLTPHHLAPLPTGSDPDEMTLAPYGTYNAGIFGVRKVEEALRFLEWWAGWMADPRHLPLDWAYDQIWLNYVPVYCRDAGIFYGAGYNVAFWNYQERQLQEKNGDFFCGRDPLVLYHFSNFDDQNPERIVMPSLSCRIKQTRTLTMLGKKIAALWQAKGRDECQGWGYGYRVWPGGDEVLDWQRELVRENWDELELKADSSEKRTRAEVVEGLYRFCCGLGEGRVKGRIRSTRSALLDLSLRKIWARLRRCCA